MVGKHVKVNEVVMNKIADVITNWLLCCKTKNERHWRDIGIDVVFVSREKHEAVSKGTLL